jgi:hypothetical protein
VQSAFDRHATQLPSGAQSLFGSEVQSVFARHCTHVIDESWQSRVEPEHCALLMQPTRHVKSCASQMGCAAPQSVLLRHSTHWPSAKRH